MYIFPVTKNKKPKTATGFKEAKPEEEWDVASEYWGAPCGKLNGFVVVDVDKKHGGLETAEGLAWGEPYVIDTPGGGKHFYYRYTPEIEAATNKVEFLPGIDFRTEGGYVVLYGEVPDHLNPPPAWLVETLTSKAETLFKAASSDGVITGGRNNYLTKAAGKLQRSGLLTLEALEAINKRDCSPPITDKELVTIFNSVSRYAPAAAIKEDFVAEPETPLYIPVKEVVEDLTRYLSDESLISGQPLGVPGIDSLLGGGLRAGELVGVMAPAKAGKSAFTHKIIHNWISMGKAVGYASRELRPSTEVMPNLLSIEWQRNALKLKSNEIGKIKDTVNKWNLFFSYGFGYMPLKEIRRWCVALKEGYGVELFVFDHLHHFCGDEDYKNVADFSRGIKQLMLDLGTAAILVIQPKQLTEYVDRNGKRQRPKMSVNLIRGGASVGQALDALLVLDRVMDSAGETATNVVRVRLDVARHKLAHPGDIYLAYDRDTMDYVEVEPVEEEEPAVKERDRPVADFGRNAAWDKGGI